MRRFDRIVEPGAQPGRVHMATAAAAAGPGEHYLDVAGKGASITRDDLVGLHEPADLEPHVVADMVDEALAAVDEWPTVADRNGVDADTIEHAAARLPALGL